MVNNQEFSKRLKKILDFYGISATAFSEKIDFNRSTISHLLSGRNKPSLEFVMKVLNQFPEVELYWLLNGTGSFPSTSSSHISSEIGSKKMSRQISEEKNTISDRLEKAEKLESKILDTVSITNTVKGNLEKAISSQEIERIVIFYKDGSFKSYE